MTSPCLSRSLQNSARTNSPPRRESTACVVGDLEALRHAFHTRLAAITYPTDQRESIFHHPSRANFADPFSPWFLSTHRDGRRTPGVGPPPREAVVKQACSPVTGVQYLHKWTAHMVHRRGSPRILLIQKGTCRKVAIAGGGTVRELPPVSTEAVVGGLYCRGEESRAVFDPWRCSAGEHNMARCDQVVPLSRHATV